MLNIRARKILMLILVVEALTAALAGMAVAQVFKGSTTGRSKGARCSSRRVAGVWLMRFSPELASALQD
jgi:hypothetical protein